MKSRLRIAFFGSSLVSTFWNGAAPYYRGIIRALASRGHRVTFYEPAASDQQQYRDLPDPDWAEVVVYRGDSHWSVLNTVAQARDADLIVKIGGVGAYDEVLESAVLDLKTAANLVAFWDVDAPATLDRTAHNFTDPFRPLIPRYDVILTYGGGPPVVAAYEALGARCCVPIYNAVDPSMHFPALPDPRFAGDLGFLGHRFPDREARVEEFFLRAAELLPRQKFLLGGSGWANRPLPSNVNCTGPIYASDHNAFNATPTAVLNINREHTARDGFYPPTRLFEAASTGVCLISDAWPGLELFLEPGREVLAAHDGAEVAQYVENLTPRRAAMLGDAARQRVLARHTYAHRVEQLEAVLEGRSNQETQPENRRSLDPWTQLNGIESEANR